MKKKLFTRIAFIVLAMALGVVLAGCGKHSRKSVVIMQHPETMDFINCEVDAWTTPASYAKNEACVEDLKKKGYVVWGER